MESTKSSDQYELTPDVEKRLYELAKISSEIRRRGLIVTYISFLDVFSLTVAGLMKAFPILWFIPMAIIFTSISLSVLGFFFLLVWDRTRDQGMIIYEEISDELEWRHRTYRSRKTRSQTEDGNNLAGRPPLNIRLILRRFLVSSRLPFAPQERDSIFYAGLLLSCIFMAVFLLIATRHYY